MGLGLGLFLVYLLFNKSKTIYANRFLALILVFTIFQLLNFLIFANGLNIDIPRIALFFSTSTLLLGPLHFLYTFFLSNQKLEFKPKYILLCLLFALANLFFIPLYLKPSTEVYNYFYENQAFFNAMNYISSIQSIVFMILSLKVLKKSLKRVKNSYSVIDKINLNWLKILTYLILLFISILLVNLFLDSIIDLPEYFNPGPIAALLLTLMIYITGFLGLRQPEIILIATPDTIKKYKTSGLSATQAEIIRSKLLQVIETEKPFLDKDLTILKLASMLNTSTAYLSQVINEKMNKNFYDLINYYRIKEAKKRMADPKYSHYTLLGIAFDVGFNSKSTFNSIFKKYTNQTPSQYSKSLTKK
ncbi:AraC family transcriptional regulator [Lentimicrobium sp. S6]|uniref:helix-turn-helix domain-containing protein n=1 Tax=Lentimicrobium sp. S6 TaxID=2735872 RepID=UPI001551E45B|nr:helix-turn-helix domain-containing protein [Lentimicrobium sp. S6]NPD48061.1 AraC family transcriptional regulator [Lentimicrobium sp. S6]